MDLSKIKNHMSGSRGNDTCRVSMIANVEVLHPPPNMIDDESGPCSPGGVMETNATKTGATRNPASYITSGTIACSSKSRPRITKSPKLLSFVHRSISPMEA